MTQELPEVMNGTGDLLLLCDHASDRVPDGIELGVDPEVMAKHIAIDIGAAAVTRRLSVALDVPAILATVSRLVIDLHREPDHDGLIPVISDGQRIAGNEGVDRDERIARFHAPYHAAIAEQIAARRPSLIAAIHSFTPEMESGGTARPWEIGILYNRDGRAARIALAELRKRGVVTGDNEPYSGKLLNATLNRHAEAANIPYLSVEIRNDLIRDDEGVAKWSRTVEEMLRAIGNSLASEA
tara:strand:- start:450 stop:1172 length:723 start_codon:yes stop_codon:yes gene_type:complete